MRKAELTMAEQKKYDVIKSVADHDGNKNRAAMELGCSRRTVDRLVLGYRKRGKQFFSHGNKKRRPVTALSEKTKRDIIGLYNMKYYDCTYKLFSELLAKEENTVVSISTVRNILMDEYILSPRAKRATIKRTKAELEKKREEPVPKRVRSEIDKKLISIEDAHPRRPRSANFGEEIQMDASVYDWFGGKDTYLHAAIDDATGAIAGAYFGHQETLDGYYHVFGQILLSHGIPYKFRTDRRTVFEYRLTGGNRAEDDTCTQFAYACKQLGVHIETTSIPQGKARIERLFGTLKGRLPILLRLAGITTVEAANEFLNSYIKEFNDRFALGFNGMPSVFEKQPPEEKINITLAVLAGRVVDSGHCVKFNKKFYSLTGKDGRPRYFRKGTKALVIKAFDGKLFATADEDVLVLEEVPAHSLSSKEFDTGSKDKNTEAKWIPPMSHPWKKESFDKFCKKQRHRADLQPAC